MKNLITILLIAVIAFSSCTNKASHEVQWSSGGKDSVVYVHYQNPNSGSLDNFYMDYILFNSLFHNGGYGNVYNYYTSHQYNYGINNVARYRNYSSNNNTRSLHNEIGNSRMTSTPSRSLPATRSNSSSYSSGRGYSSPSRSYGSSYSSPSRSFSSGSSRGFSSPSRGR